MINEENNYLIIIQKLLENANFFFKVIHKQIKLSKLVIHMQSHDPIDDDRIYRKKTCWLLVPHEVNYYLMYYFPVLESNSV